MLQKSLADQHTALNNDNEKEVVPQVEAAKTIEYIQAENKAVVKELEHEAEAKVERLREEYNREIQSIVQMLKEEKEKSNKKDELLREKDQQIDTLTELHQPAEENEKTDESEDVAMSSAPNDFDIAEWRSKEVKWEESRKTLESTIHKLKEEIREQNEFMELRKKGKNLSILL